MKIANIDREFFHIFWTTWGNSMKFSGKMCFKIILKVTKNQGFTISLDDKVFEKPQQRKSNWPPPPAVLGLRVTCSFVLVVTWDDVTHKRSYISTSMSPYSTKLEMVMAFEMMSIPSMVAWHNNHVTNKKALSLFLHGSWLTNWTRWWLIVLDYHKKRRLGFWSCDYM